MQILKLFLFCIHSVILELSQIHRCKEPHGEKCANDVDLCLAGTLDCMMTLAERCHWKERVKKRALLKYLSVNSE